MAEENKEEQLEQKEVSIVEEAKKEREQTEKLLMEMKDERKKLETLKAQEILGGQTNAGEVQEKKEETPQEYAKRVMAGKI